jgi:AhpD family alkylhydroperoxidase
MPVPDHPEVRRELEQLVARLLEAAPAARRFGPLHGATMADGELTRSTKELVALGIAVATHCEPCIAYHVHDALQAGATRAQIAEALAVAVTMGGGPALMYGAQALLAVDQYLGTTGDAV